MSLNKLDYSIIGIINHSVGDKVKEIPNYETRTSTDKPISCEIVYIHPKGRFYTCEFSFGERKFRESYTVRTEINPVILY